MSQGQCFFWSANNNIMCGKIVVFLFVITAITAKSVRIDDGKYRPSKYVIFDDGRYNRPPNEGKYIPGDEGRYTYIYRQYQDHIPKYVHIMGPGDGQYNDKLWKYLSSDETKFINEVSPFCDCKSVNGFKKSSFSGIPYLPSNPRKRLQTNYTIHEIKDEQVVSENDTGYQSNDEDEDNRNNDMVLIYENTPISQEAKKSESSTNSFPLPKEGHLDDTNNNEISSPFSSIEISRAEADVNSETTSEKPTTIYQEFASNISEQFSTLSTAIFGKSSLNSQQKIIDSNLNKDSTAMKEEISTTTDSTIEASFDARVTLEQHLQLPFEDEKNFVVQEENSGLSRSAEEVMQEQRNEIAKTLTLIDIAEGVMKFTDEVEMSTMSSQDSTTATYNPDLTSTSSTTTSESEEEISKKLIEEFSLDAKSNVQSYTETSNGNKKLKITKIMVFMTTTEEMD